MGRVKGSQRRSRCTHAGTMVQFFCDTSLHFCFVLLGSNPPLYFFLTPTLNLVVTSPAYILHVDTLLSCNLRDTFNGETCAHFTLGNRCASCVLPTEIMRHIKVIFLSISNTKTNVLSLRDRCMSSYRSQVQAGGKYMKNILIFLSTKQYILYPFPKIGVINYPRTMMIVVNCGEFCPK